VIVFGIWPANSINDEDIEIYDINSAEHIATLHNLRQQVMKSKDQEVCFSLSDFIAPRDSGVTDYIGAFAVTAGIGADELAKHYEDAGDDYNAIMVKALADRLAEALAEQLHKQVRTNYWAYASNEQTSNDDLIREKYQGIRPAPGYPACPDHSEKATLFSLLEVEKNIDLKLTEHFAMYPTAAVSGWYYAHPQAKYFNVGKIERDQVESIAKRKNKSVAEMEKWLQHILNYDN